ncbi:hypothetical protein SSX86_004170 [Deinandra increscens subsp. villosa]|uniref:Uncharacterized protein n=1 Tax=Deinandra increscens subsp. villosa TaxID=3103831 RepID=A0AAP0H8L4_9ASTR
MTESDEYVMVEIPRNQPDSVAKEWASSLRGKETIKGYEREQRHMEKVPPLILKSEKGRRNRERYEPAVVSLGPYHHNRASLAQGEKCKLITLEEYSLGTGKPVALLYEKVFAVVHDARKCYIDGSTDAYTDHEFNQMMLRDACFILSFIENVSRASDKIFLNSEYLGYIGLANAIPDLFVLENQIPFVVLQVLLKLKFPDDEGEDVLNRFFNYLNYGEVVVRNEKVLNNKHRYPLHLLELYRSYFISLSVSPSTSSPKESKGNDSVEDFNYVKRSRSFASVTELKARWIFMKRMEDEPSGAVEFNSNRFYGEFKLVRRALSTYTKSIYLNMIAYEMCPHNPNDLRISTYLKVMKALIIERDDVKELRNNGILLHSLSHDEEVVKMFDEIEVPGVNLYMYNELRLGIESIQLHKFKTWVAELITEYLSSPWKATGLLVGAALLVTSIVQTYFAINSED